MPRQGRSGRTAPSRPTVAPARPTPQQQTRPSSTAAAPMKPTQSAPSGQAPPAQQQASGGSGLFGQMASTAAGVAVGSSIGHAIGGFFGGGSGAAEPAQDSGAVAAQGAEQKNAWGESSCGNHVVELSKCLDENSGNMQICDWYRQQLKACQGAASQY